MPEAGHYELFERTESHVAQIASLVLQPDEWLARAEKLKARIAEDFSVKTMTDGILEGYATAMARR